MVIINNEKSKQVRVNLEYCGGGYEYVDTHRPMSCGQLGELDIGGGYPAYRCEYCGALEGSSGQSIKCRNSE